jgi:hypothetical protein
MNGLVNANNEIQARQLKADKPFCWQSKSAMKTIADIFDATRNTASARSVYVAMTEFQSDEGSGSFTRTIAQIASRAGVSYRTTTTILNCFEEANFIAVKRNTIAGTKLQAPSTYTLLGNGCLSLSNGKLNPLPRLRKKGKNLKNLNTANAPGHGSMCKVKSKRQRPASPGLEGKGKDSDWLRRTPPHVLQRRLQQYRDERSQLLKRYSNGASNDQQKLDRFHRDAPPEVQRRYDWLRPKVEEIEQAITERSRP